MCIFSVHNLIADPPFSRLDLVSCQNVLIYIEAAPQRKILQSFYYGLKPGGFLFLGRSETIGNATELFEPLEKDLRLYKKKLAVKRVLLDFSVRPHMVTPSKGRIMPDQRTQGDVEHEFDKILLSRYVPASVLVNKDMEILRFRGSVSAFFEPASGKASLNLLKMVKEDLVFEIRSLFQRARKSISVISKSGITIDSILEPITIEISPIKSGKEFYYLIIFKIVSTIPGSEKNKTKKGDTKSRITKLERALKDAREHLRTSTEDFDVAREELQSANEEILSSNEELQSINEELETSKEELQSANEELTTINEELENRINELKESHDYIQAIIETIHGPLLVVSRQMRVRTANKAFYEFFQLKREETDGRYIDDLGNGKWNIPALSVQLRELVPNRMQFKDFEISHSFPGIGDRKMKVNAHLLTKIQSESQILLAFHDITEFRNNEVKLLEAQQQLKLALEGGQVGTWVWNIKTNAVSGSTQEEMIFGLQEGKFFNDFDDWQKAVHPDDRQFIKEKVKSCIVNKTPLDAEFRIKHASGQVRWVLSKANAYYDAEGKPDMMIGINIDITERKQAVEALVESERRFHMLSDQAPVMIWMTDQRQSCNFVNKTWLDFTGKKIEDELGHGWYEGIHPQDREEFLTIYNDSFQEKDEFKTDYRLRRHDGQYRWIMVHGVPRYTDHEGFIGYIGTCIDITDRIELEKQKDDFMSIASHELKTPVTSIKAYAQILKQKQAEGITTLNADVLDRLNNQIDKLTQLINMLLDVARIQSGQLELERSNFDAKTFVNEVIEEIHPAAVRERIKVTMHIDDHDQLFADRSRISQVLENLLSNALKYSPPEKPVSVLV